MLNSGCLELIVVAAAVVGIATFVIACILNLHTGLTPSLSILRALSVAAISLVSATLFLPVAFVAMIFLSDKMTKRKP